MARTVRAFAPLENLKITFTAETASESVTFTVQRSVGPTFLYGSSTSFPNVLRVDNQADKAVYIKSGVGATTATNTDYEVKAGTIAYIDIGQNDTVAAIPDSVATGVVFLARGLGSN